MCNDKKSQVTMEFLFLVSFVFVFSLAFVVAVGIQLTDFSDNQKKDTTVDFGDSIRKEMDIASVVKNGYIRKIVLPDMIDDSINYTIQMSNYTLIISTDNYEYSAKISYFEGTLQKGNNTLKKINNTV